MKHNLIFITMLYLLCTETSADPTEWTIVGAGPAGIIATGLLLDAGINAQQIRWIDPAFNAGWLGKYCENVPANAQTKIFKEFIQAINEFSILRTESIQKLLAYDSEKEYELSIIIDPLRDITQHLLKKTIGIYAKVTSLSYHDEQWHLQLSNGKQLFSKKVILATGGHPKDLTFDHEKTIPLHDALDKKRLSNYIEPEDTIGVVGSAHSAILILKHLYELQAKRIINFFKNPIVYPTPMDDWILHENTGLRGETARWAQNVLEKEQPASILRIKNTDETQNPWLLICTKIIYACGFIPDAPPINNGQTYPPSCYNCNNSSIAPGLFGIGIAFPEKWETPGGTMEVGIGIPYFLSYAQKVLPSWLKKSSDISHLTRLNEFINITAL